MTNSDISLVINTYSKPMAFEEIYIDRKSLIDDIKYTNKMSESNKIKSIDEVNSIKFICVDKAIDAVTNDKNTLVVTLNILRMRN
jgi:hypothetical protein